MTSEPEGDRYVVRLVCGHEILDVPAAGQPSVAAGDHRHCSECGLTREVREAFRVEP